MNFFNTKLFMKMKNLLSILLVMIVIISLVGCNDESKDEQGPAYDPSKPVKLTDFFPNSGRFQEKILLNGENFGTDPSIIKVYFNSKLAPVIGSTGTRMYIQAPRLPGDTCTISVVIGNDSIFYDEKFLYESSVTVTTIAGNGNSGFQDGDLSQSELVPQWLCVDKDDNIFVSNVTGWGFFHILRIDEEENELVIVGRDIIAGILAANPITGVISGSSESVLGGFYTLDPANYWAPKLFVARWTNPSETPSTPFNPGNVINPIDGNIYTHFANEGVMKINSETWEAERILDIGGGVNGMTFRANEPNILYMIFRGTSQYLPNRIVRFDVNDPENTFEVVNNISAAGHRDGALENAQFNDVRMIAGDFEGNIYMADYGNHCIRRLTPDNMVETVLGTPGTPGWRDGNKDEALFRGPTGIGVTSDGTVYVAEQDNRRVRKLTIN